MNDCARSRDRSVGIAPGYGLDDPSCILSSDRYFSLHSIQTDFGAHTASYPIDTASDFPRCKAAEE
jgi:hypothetical protein